VEVGLDEDDLGILQELHGYLLSCLERRASRTDPLDKYEISLIEIITN